MRIHINFSVVLPLFTRVAQDLKARYGVEDFCGFVYGRESICDLQRVPFPTDSVVTFTDALREFGDRDPDLDFLCDRERRYGDPNLYPMIAACRSVSEFSHRRGLQVLEVGLRVIEALFDEYRPSAVISDGVACTMG